MKPIPYALALHQDELLYSWLGQLAVFNAHGDHREWLRNLFGVPREGLSFDLPCGIMDIQNSLGPIFPYSDVDVAIEYGTVYPFHRAFIDPERHEVATLLLKHGGLNLKHCLGRIGNRFGVEYLRACPYCAAHEINTLGYALWHVSHNVPGVICCVKHATLLEKFCVPARVSYRAPFVAFDLSSVPQNKGRASPQQMRISTLCATALQRKNGPVESGVRKAAYWDAAASHGYMLSSGRPDYFRIAHDIRERYHDFIGVEYRDRLLASANSPMRWISDLFLRPDRALHPVCHLLLADLLWDSLDSYFTICQNPPAQFCRQAALEAAPTASLSEIPAQILRDTSLSCRQVAAATGSSVTTISLRRKQLGLYVSNRPKHIDALKIDWIQNEILCGCDLKEIAARAGVSLPSVYRIRCLIEPKVEMKKAEQLVMRRADYRDNWIRLLKAHREGGIRRARAQSASTYMWLYRHDKKGPVSSDC